MTFRMSTSFATYLENDLPFTFHIIQCETLKISKQLHIASYATYQQLWTKTEACHRSEKGKDDLTNLQFLHKKYFSPHKDLPHKTFKCLLNFSPVVPT